MTTKHLPVLGGHPVGFAATRRIDLWWVGPTITFLVLSAFVVYATWAGLQGEHYYAVSYLSPFYSPVLFTNEGLGALGAAPLWHSWFGQWPAWWPDFVPASPGILIIGVPVSFRLTCYYYRKAYYRSFAASPPACAVVGREAKPSYKGETTFLLVQNLHRFALYFALLYVPILYYDAVVAFSHDGKLGIGVGSVVLFVNATLLAGYAFGCHSFRHLVGGGTDCMSCGEATIRHKSWKIATWFNERHMLFAWTSLVWVGGTDLYIRLVSMGVIRDFNTWT